MDLSYLKPKVKNKKPKRVGRGTGSGHGKTSGRGHKGAGQRSGKKRPYEGFAGGNIPYLRRIPKRGFNPPKRVEYQIVNLEEVQRKIKDVEIIDPGVLKRVNLIKNENKPVKILANLSGDFNLKATFKADKFSKKAKEIIESVGGKAECLKR